MFARSVLFLLGILSLAWIVYVSIELTSNENKFNPIYLFAPEDSVVLVSNELTNYETLRTIQSTTKENTSILELITPINSMSLYVSLKRNHLLFESKNPISEATITSLFSNHPELKFTGSNSFKIDNYIGAFNKKYCYLFTETFARNEPNYTAFVFDKNATGTVLGISKSGFSAKDIYFKESGIYEYKSTNKNNLHGNKVDDAALFSSIISSGITAYQFYEVDYLRSIDPKFSKSPMNDWVKNGIVQVKLKGETAVITDYITGQNPINVLYEFAQKEPENDEHAHFENIQLTSLLPENKDVYVFLLDDYAVISSSKALCERILADYKLGSTIAQSDAKRTEIYDKLPKKVNHRIVEGTIKQSTSVSAQTLLTTTVVSDQNLAIENVETQSSKGMDLGEGIHSFYSIDENQLFVLTKNNKVVFFENNLKKWTKSITGKVVGEPEIIDLLGNEKSQLLITTDKFIYLVDVNGEEVNGFPIDLENQTATFASTFYRWQGSGYFLVAIDNSKIIQYDTRGRELTVIKSQIKSSQLKPVVWASANKPFLGLYDGTTFEMIELTSRKSFRKFNAINITHYTFKPNEINLIGFEKNNLIMYNQKGEKAVYGTFENGEIVGIQQQGKNPTILLKTKNVVHLINNQGIEWGTVRVPFNEIDDLQLHELINGKLILSIVDGIENNVYLYGTDGQKWSQETWEASTKIQLFQPNNRSLKIFTIVDNLIVEYKQN